MERGLEVFPSCNFNGNWDWDWDWGLGLVTFRNMYYCCTTEVLESAILLYTVHCAVTRPNSKFQFLKLICSNLSDLTVDS